MEQGALTLASPEVRFELDNETSNPLDVSLYVSLSLSLQTPIVQILNEIASPRR